MFDFRFRLYTAAGVGASTVVTAANQAEALAKLNKMLPNWEHAVALHGPEQSKYFFTH